MLLNIGVDEVSGDKLTKELPVKLELAKAKLLNYQIQKQIINQNSFTINNPGVKL